MSNELNPQDLKNGFEILNRKLDKILNMQTKIAKTLHLLPVTPEEEKEFYRIRQQNSKHALEVATELTEAANEKQETYALPNLISFISDVSVSPFSDILADDLRGGDKI